jgi:hypothetical protein
MTQPTLDVTRDLLAFLWAGLSPTLRDEADPVSARRASRRSTSGQSRSASSPAIADSCAAAAP